MARSGGAECSLETVRTEGTFLAPAWSIFGSERSESNAGSHFEDIQPSLSCRQIKEFQSSVYRGKTHYARVIDRLLKVAPITGGGHGFERCVHNPLFHTPNDFFFAVSGENQVRQARIEFFQARGTSSGHRIGPPQFVMRGEKIGDLVHDRLLFPGWPADIGGPC